jgi:hypothetical protein
MESAFPTFQSDAQSSMAASTAAMGSGAAAARVGMKQQIAVLEDTAAETAAALRAAVERAAADKEELTGLIGAMETRLMAEIERLREESNNNFTALRAGIDATRKTLVVHKGEAAVHGEKLRGTAARLGTMDDRLTELILELDGSTD